MNNEIKIYKENGYLLIKNFFDIETLLNVKNEAVSYFENQFKKFNLNGRVDEKMVQLFNLDFETFTNCGKHIQQGSIQLHSLCINEKLINKLKQLGIEAPSIATRPVLFFNNQNLAKEKVYYKTPQHQDWNSIRGSRDSIVVWIPLMNINKEDGALRVVPKSHNQGPLMTDIVGGFGCIDKYIPQDFVDIPMQLGDILIFSTFLVHESGEISNNNIRWSCSFRYNNLLDNDFINRRYEFNYIYKPKIQE